MLFCDIFIHLDSQISKIAIFKFNLAHKFYIFPTYLHSHHPLLPACLPHLPGHRCLPHDHIQSFLVEFIFNEKDKERRLMAFVL